MFGRAPRRRAVIVHYHLFKNGGTSIERVLRDSYGKRWATFDKAQSGAKISAAEMQAFIEGNPSLKAVSSHQAVTTRTHWRFRRAAGGVPPRPAVARALGLSVRMAEAARARGPEKVAWQPTSSTSSRSRIPV